MKDLISIIVPVYNVADYLHQCLDSLINQTYRNIEIIIINDGSTDNSFDICKEYAERDSRIRLFTQENGGLSSARNKGLENAKGQYIAFVDSDDWVHESMYESLHKAIKEYNADIATCGINMVYGDAIYPTSSGNGTVDVKGRLEAIEQLLDDKYNVRFEVWNKLFRKDIISSIRFKKGQVFEDIYFERNVFHSVDKVATVNSNLLYYRVSRPGNTNSKFGENKFSMFLELEDFVEELRKEGQNAIADKFEVDELVTAINFYVAATGLAASESIISGIVSWFYKIYTRKKHNKLLRNGRFRLFALSPKLYMMCRYLLKLV